VIHVRTFAIDKTIVRRETDGPMSIMSYYIAYVLVDIIWLTIIPLVFSIPYVYFIVPNTKLGTFYTVYLLICWWSSGMAYLISSLPLGVQWINLISVFISIIMGAFLHGLNPSLAESKNNIMNNVLGLSYNRWAMEILTISEMKTVERDYMNIIYIMKQKIGICLAAHNDMDEVQAKLSLIRDMYSNNSIMNDCNKASQYAFFYFTLNWNMLPIISIYTNVATE